MRFEPDHFDAQPTDSDMTELEVLNDLQDETGVSPDLTKSIMGQLGYMKASKTAIRKATIRRWRHRAVLATAAMVSLGVGIYLFNNSSEARKPVQTTIHEALVNDIEHRSEGLGQLLQPFRTLPAAEDIQLKPSDPEPVEAFETSEAELPDEAKAPFRWS